MSRKVEINKEHLLLLISEKKTKKEIAKELKCGTASVYTALREYGITILIKYNKNKFVFPEVRVITVESNPLTPEQERINDLYFMSKEKKTDIATPKSLLDRGMFLCSTCAKLLSVDNKFCKLCNEYSPILTHSKNKPR